MDEHRKYPRFECSIKAAFNYYEGNPDQIGNEPVTTKKGKGLIIDLSIGGLLIATRERVQVNMPVKVSFTYKKESHLVTGEIVRTGLLRDNPSEGVQKFSRTPVREDAYIAVRFDSPIEEFWTSDDQN